MHSVFSKNKYSLQQRTRQEHQCTPAHQSHSVCLETHSDPLGIKYTALDRLAETSFNRNFYWRQFLPSQHWRQSGLWKEHFDSKVMTNNLCIGIVYIPLNSFCSEMFWTFEFIAISWRLNDSCMPCCQFGTMLTRWIIETVFHVYLLSCMQVNLVWKSGPSGAHAQLLVVKGRRCEPELVYHLTGHTAAAH